jgi:DNA modification methylase
LQSDARPVAQSGALFYGDNLDVLRRYVDDESVDLVYLDPPFNSNANYNVLFAEQDGSRSASQIKAFEDTWRWDQEAARTYEEVAEAGGDVSNAMRAFRTILPESNMLAYLAMMAPRLVELRRILRPTGSLYLHCDPTASHYLKLLLDAVFGPENYRNEITWKRAQTVKGNFGQGARFFGRNTDALLFYSATENHYFETPFLPYSDDYVATAYRHVEPDSGRRYRLVSMIGPGGAAKGNPQYEVMGVTRYWRYSKEAMKALIDNGLVVQSKPGGVPNRKYYLDEGRGVPVQALWDDLPALQAASSERLGYPTQKPEALLTRIIKASCPPDGVVLDPFCGCGTTIAAAEKLDRRWIGIDVTFQATNLIKHRLFDAFGDAVPYTVVGEPTTVEDAKKLAKEDRDQFEAWALGLVGARNAGKKKGADGGIDGQLLFHEKAGGKTRQALISVKSGKVTVADVRDLRGVIEREEAEIGLLISLREPTQPMRAEAAAAGLYRSGSEGVGTWGEHPRMQLLTVAELLDGRRIDMPPPSGNLTFRRAPRVGRRRPTTKPLFRNVSTPPKLEEMFQQTSS